MPVGRRLLRGGPSNGDAEADDGRVEQEGGTFSGTVTAAEPIDEETFEVEETDHEQLTMVLQLEGVATAIVTAPIEGPNGTEATLEAGPDETSDAATVEDPRHGQRQVTVQLSSGVNQDYSFAWCAPGEGSDHGDAASACAQVEGAEGPGLQLVPAAPGS